MTQRTERDDNETIQAEPPETCVGCVFAAYGRAPGAVETQLWCRRYPPSVQLLPTAQGVAAATFRVSVAPDDWCGEHVPGAPAELASEVGSLARVGGLA